MTMTLEQLKHRLDHFGMYVESYNEGYLIVHKKFDDIQVVRVDREADGELVTTPYPNTDISFSPKELSDYLGVLRLVNKYVQDHQGPEAGAKRDFLDTLQRFHVKNGSVVDADGGKFLLGYKKIGQSKCLYIIDLYDGQVITSKDHSVKSHGLLLWKTCKARMADGIPPKIKGVYPCMDDYDMAATNGGGYIDQ